MSKMLKIDIINALKNNNIKFNYSDKKQQLLLLARKNKIKFGGDVTPKICAKVSKRNQPIPYNEQATQDLKKIDNIKYYINGILLHGRKRLDHTRKTFEEGIDMNIIDIDFIELIQKYIEIVNLLNENYQKLYILERDGRDKKLSNTEINNLKSVNEIYNQYKYYYKCVMDKDRFPLITISVDSWNLYNEICRLFLYIYHSKKLNFSLSNKQKLKKTGDSIKILKSLREINDYFKTPTKYRNKKILSVKEMKMKFIQGYKNNIYRHLNKNFTNNVNRLFPNNLPNMNKRNSTRSSSTRSSSRISRSSSTNGRTSF